MAPVGTDLLENLLDSAPCRFVNVCRFWSKTDLRFRRLHVFDYYKISKISICEKSSFVSICLRFLAKKDFQHSGGISMSLLVLMYETQASGR
jgi:hypothetical protein